MYILEEAENKKRDEERRKRKKGNEEGNRRKGRKKLERGHDEIIYITNSDKLQISVLPFQGLIVPVDHWNQSSDSNSEDFEGDFEHSRNMICYLFYPYVKDQYSTLWRIDWNRTQWQEDQPCRPW